jgi:hypothetical protein
LESGSNHKLRKRLLQALSREPEARVDSKVVAGSAVRLHDRLAARLSPLIGDVGVSALWTRSLYLTQREFAWLARMPPSAPDESPVTQLRLCLERQPPSTATEAAAAVLATFYGLLATLLGDALTIRLTREAWPDIATEGTPEEKTSR